MGGIIPAGSIPHSVVPSAPAAVSAPAIPVVPASAPIPAPVIPIASDAAAAAAAHPITGPPKAPIQDPG